MEWHTEQDKPEVGRTVLIWWPHSQPFFCKVMKHKWGELFYLPYGGGYIGQTVSHEWAYLDAVVELYPFEDWLLTRS